VLAPLSDAGYTVIAPDLRGTGDSDKPSSGYSERQVAPGVTAEDRADMLEHYAAPGRMRGGFQHYGALPGDSRDNKVTSAQPLRKPVLVLNGEKGLPQGALLHGVHRAATDVHADIVPGAGHTYATDNPAWTAQRLVRFFTDGT
jgi:pimeloyl-ACP methyl ester carboxylesterase